MIGGHPFSWRGANLWTLWLAALWASSCVIEERRFDEELARAHRGDDRGEDSSTEDASDEDEQDEDEQDEDEQDADNGQAPEHCRRYCKLVMDSCTGPHAVYASEASCLALCAQLPAGTDDDPAGNTVACRTQQALLAASTGEPHAHCAAAGPGGSTTTVGDSCGSDCESYCLLHRNICDLDEELVISNQAECERRCQAVPDRGAFDVDFDYDGDSIQCRLVHLSSAALGKSAAESHCWHSRLAPAMDSPCHTLPETPADCAHYCRVVQTACVEQYQVYDDEQQCLATCAALPLGEYGETIENTVGCRIYHAYSALNAPAAHCSHAGPAGDGHCGVDNCESYCQLAQQSCPEAFDEKFDSQASCLEQCAEIPGAHADSGYDLKAAGSEHSVACRIYHATKVLAAGDEGVEASACEAVLGGAACAP